MRTRPGRTASARVDLSAPNSARLYNYWLGGKDHFAADRAAGDAIEVAFPAIRRAVVENRQFLRRTVTHLTTQGIRQFIDLGPGFPMACDTHRVAQASAPTCRVAYVDHDPMVQAHGRALHMGTAEGSLTHIDADLRDPDSILTHAALPATIDLSQPVALLLLAVLEFIPDDDEPYHAVARLVDALAPRSYLVVSHTTVDHLGGPAADALREHMPEPFQPRTRDEVARFLSGLSPTSVGPDGTGRWLTDPAAEQDTEAVAYAAAAQKPPEDGGRVWRIPPAAISVARGVNP